MMGDTSYMYVFQEECLLLYFKNSSLTRRDIEEMPPYEREMMLEMFKRFNEESSGKNKKNGQNVMSGPSSMEDIM